MQVICNPGLPQASRGLDGALTSYLEEVVTRAALVTWSPTKRLITSYIPHLGRYAAKMGF
jgi:hypothetical protein